MKKSVLQIVVMGGDFSRGSQTAEYNIKCNISAAQLTAESCPVPVICAVVTLGGNGAAYNDAGEVKHCPAQKTTVVDTTATGDSFIGAECALHSARENQWSRRFYLPQRLRRLL